MKFLKFLIVFVFIFTFAIVLQADRSLSGNGKVQIVKGEATAVDSQKEKKAPSGSNWVQRDPQKNWWIYKQKPPYTRIGIPTEEMKWEEIRIDEILTLNIYQENSLNALIPQELLINPEKDRSFISSYDGGYYLIKLDTFRREDSWIEELEKIGVVLSEYIPINTYIAFVPSYALSSIKNLPYVKWVGDYHPAYKISPRIGTFYVPPDVAFDVNGNPLPYKLELHLHKAAEVKDVLFDLGTLGIFPDLERDVVEGKDFKTIFVYAEPSQIFQIAHIPGVKFIEEAPYMKLLAGTTPNEVATVLQNYDGVYNSNKSVSWDLWNNNLDGTNQIITMMDSGIAFSMYHFAQSTSSAGTPGPSHRKVVGWTAYGTSGDTCVCNYSTADGGHGTWTSQHAAGDISGIPGQNENYDTGIARRAKIYFEDIGPATCTGSVYPPSDLTASINDAISKGSYIQNHSWGGSNTYDTYAQTIDSALLSNPNFVVTVSAGNSGQNGAGSIGSPATAKNAIAVGGTDQDPYLNYLFIDCNWDGTSTCASTDVGSSRGPVATSNRVKPDILAIMADSSGAGGNSAGEAMAGERPHAMCLSSPLAPYWDWNSTSYYAGTSFSAPQVAGLAAIVRQYFMAGWYPSGSPNPSNAFTPSGSLIKAVILASGQDMNTTAYPTTSISIAKRYSSDVGYGRVNLARVLEISNISTLRQLWAYNNVAIANGDTKTYTFNITGNTDPLKVMLAWYDTAQNNLDKNLNLTVTIGANTYKGNVFSNGWSTTGGSYDATNNTEGVFLQPSQLPSSGTITVQVNAYNAVGGANFSLVVSGDVQDVGTTEVALDKAIYDCADTLVVTVTDSNASSPVNVTLTTSNGDSLTVQCTGSGGIFTSNPITVVGGTPNTSDQILQVANGGTITATYNDTNPVQTLTDQGTVDCQANIQDGGYLMSGGCDEVTSWSQLPLDHAANFPSELYTPYMDNGEYISYTFGIYNAEAIDLTDARVQLSLSGPGASYVTILSSNPVYVGRIAAQTVTGAVFQFYINGAPALSQLNITASVTSPADGFTTPIQITQTTYLQADDLVTQYTQCWHHTSAEGWVGRQYYTSAACPWSASTSTKCGFENRTDCPCNEAGGIHTHKSAAEGNNCNGTMVSGCDEVLFTPVFGPTNTGNGPSGRPWNWGWRQHSFFYAGDMVSTTGSYTSAWGLFYDPWWNRTTQPDNGGVIDGFPYGVAYYILDINNTNTAFDWETANTGTCTHTSTSRPPNQVALNLSGIGMENSTTSTKWMFGHEVYDTTATTQGKGLLLDMEEFVWDEYYAGAETSSCTSQCGQVSFNRYSYENCPLDTAVISVMDGNGPSGSVSVTVYSLGTGDYETIVLSGGPPYYSGNLNISWLYGSLPNDGYLNVLPEDTLQATYNDSNDGTGNSCSDSEYAYTYCVGGDVVYQSHSIVLSESNGDGDNYPDTNETITIDITIKNNMLTDLTNAYVSIETTTPSIVDCIIKNTAYYGTVPAGTSKTNQTTDRFKFHISPTANCTDWQNPPRARFVVNIRGDNFEGSKTQQSFTMDVDLNTLSPPYPGYTLTQNFNSDPMWPTGVGPGDDDGVCTATTYVNDFHWCALCGNGNGGYGAWVGNNPIGTSGQTYRSFSDSCLYTPVLMASSTDPVLSFQRAYQTEATYDGAAVYWKTTSASTWTNLNFTGMAAFNPNTAYCNPLDSGATQAWSNATLQTWATSGTATLTGAANNQFQVRWRLGSDSTIVRAGFGVDDVQITNVAQTVACDNTNNSGLPGCTCNMTVDVLPNGTTTVNVNEYINFTVNVTGGMWPYTYQWTEDGVNLSGETSSTLSITKSTAQSHQYNVKVTDYYGNCLNVQDASSSTGTWVSGGCTYPSKPTITNITDNDPCAQSGITITFTAGSPATRHDLYKDGSLAQSNVTSPINYNPGDTSSHSYVVRAINGDDTCYTDSDPSSFADANSTPGTPTITSVTDVDPCATSGVQISWGAVSGATGYDLRVDGTTIVTNVTSPYTYQPGDNNSHNYEVRAKNATCTGAWSTAVAGTDANSTPGTPTITSVTDVDPCATSGVQISWGAVSGATGYDLRVDGTTIVTNVTSPYTYQPGDNNSHNYEVRAKNATCTGAWSTAVAGTDANNTPSAITLNAVNFDSSCGIQINFTGGSGATQFDLWVDGNLAQSNITSGYVYVPSDTNSHNYVVRGINGTCYTNSNTSSVADPDCGGVPPNEIVGPSFTGQIMAWQADPSATGYRVYRGIMENLSALCNATQDFCTRYNGTNTSLDISGDDPSTTTYKVFFYLITGYNGSGEGPAGTATCGARQVNTTGNCP